MAPFGKGNKIVYTEPIGEVEQISLDPSIMTEKAVRNLVMKILNQVVPISVQTILAETTSVIYKFDELHKHSLEKHPQYVGAILVSPSLKGFPIQHTPLAPGLKTKRWILPLDSQIKNYPVVGEHVAIVNYGNQTFYFSPANIKNSVNNNSEMGMNRVGSKGDKVDKSKIEAKLQGFVPNPIPRPIEQNAGDFVINGRMDQSIRIGKVDEVSNESCIKIVVAKKENEKGSMHKPRKENLKEDVSSIYMSRMEDVTLSIAPKAGNLTPSMIKGPHGQIVLDSNKITINSKAGVNNDVNIFAGDKVNIVSKNTAHLIGSKVVLGGDDISAPAMEAAVMGNQLVELLFQWTLQFQTLGINLQTAVGIGNAGGPAPIPGMNAGGAGFFGTFKDQTKEEIARAILSKNVFLSRRKLGGL
jgi:hypothetical protein